MERREQIRKIINGENTDRPGFCLGNPHPGTWPQLRSYFQANDNENVRRQLGDDIRWILYETLVFHTRQVKRSCIPFLIWMIGDAESG